MPQTSKWEFDQQVVDAYNIQEFDPYSISREPVNVSIISPTNSGKTVLMKDLLSKNAKNFDKIYLLSRTAKLQSVYDFMPRQNIIDHFDEELLTRLMEEQREKKISGAKLENFLFIMDDLINDKAFKKSRVIDNFFTEGRHFHFSTWILVQKFTGLKPIQRCNVRYAISFDCDTSNERKAFCECYLPCENNRQSDLLFKRIVREKKYQCCIIEIWKNGASVEEKVKKYVANPNVEKIKIKPIVPKQYESITGMTLRTIDDE